MKIKHTVLSLPVEDLQRSQAFYHDAMGFQVSEIEDEMVTIEITGLSLYLIDKGEYLKYCERANMKPFLSQGDSAHLITCAVEDKKTLDNALERAVEHGGHVESPAKKEEGRYTGYLKDPDGHLWELVEVSS